MQYIREHATGKLAKFLFLGILISFLSFGGSSFFRSSSIGDVAKVNGQKINQMDVDATYRNMIARLGGQLPEGDAIKALKEMSLNSLIEKVALQQQLEKWGIQASNFAIRDVIVNEEAFHDENGKFSPEIYNDLLKQQRVTPMQFEENIRTNLNLQLLFNAIAKSTFVTDAMLEDFAKINREQRSMQLIKIPFNLFKDKVNVTEEMITKAYEENKNNYLSNEKVKIEYIKLPSVKEEYRESDQLLISFSTDAEKAAGIDALQSIYKDLESGSLSFEDAKEKIKDLNGEYYSTGVTKNGVGDSTFNDVLFNMAKDQTYAAPFATANAVHLIHLINADSNQNESGKDGVTEKEYSVLEAKLQELSEQYVDSLAPISEGLNLPVTVTDWLTLSDKQGLLSDEEIYNHLMSPEVFEQGKNSLPFLSKDNEALIIRLNTHEPKRILTLEEAKPQIEEKLINEQLQSLAKDASTQFLEEVKDITDIDVLKKKAEEHHFELFDINEIAIQTIPTLSNIDEFKVNAIIAGFNIPLSALNKPVETVLDDAISITILRDIKEGKLSDYNEAEIKQIKETLKKQEAELQISLLIKSILDNSKIERYQSQYMNE